MNCISCEHPISPKQKFCGACGERIEVKPISTWLIIENFIEGITHLDAKIWVYGKKLFTQPWQIATDYLEGKRKLNFNPVLGFLIAATLLAITLHYTLEVSNRNYLQIIELNKSQISLEQYEAQLSEINASIKANEKSLSINKYFHAVNLFIYAIPFYFLIYFVYKRKHTYLEIVFVQMVFWTFIMIIYIFTRAYDFLPFQIKVKYYALNEIIVSVLTSVLIGFFYCKFLRLNVYKHILVFSSIFYLVDTYIIAELIRWVYIAFK